jgi:hypothetical protein
MDEMTTLMPRPTRPSADELRRDLRHRRPLVLLATLAGAVAAASTLVVCLALGVAGWFLTDAGIHGTPRDGLRVGALGWLMAHGSGVHVQGVAVTVMPLAITLVCAWVTWRIGHRLGDSISGHGPDAERIADGERDWTVPAATLLYTAGYAVVAVVTGALAASAETAPDSSRVLLWAVVLCGALGAPAIAIGSGRAAIWTATLPPSLLAIAAACRRVLGTWLLVSLVAFLAALVAALNVLSQLDTDTGATVLIGVVSLLVVPNAAIFSGSYLLGPGFAVGTGTLVSPAVVTVGALPMVPLLAALPDNGPTPAWTSGLVAIAPLVGAVGAVRAQRTHPTYRWEEGALHGCGGGMLAGVTFGLLAMLAGGAVGPGRMSDVAPLAFSVLVHAITAFGIGGLVGGLVMTWWQRRGMDPVEVGPSSDPEQLGSRAPDDHMGSPDQLDPELDSEPDLEPDPDPDATQADLTPVRDPDDRP